MSGRLRTRPLLHFTARQGWTNDPHGIILLDDQYHMFFQYNPDSVNWSPRCHWGHALSDDLVTWEEAEVALSPVEGEVGCWSGSAVIDDRGPVIIYTSIAADDWRLGRVVLARPGNGMFDWVRDPAKPVIAGPPDDLDIVGFRDPQVRREDGRWKALLGAGIAGFGGCALQYSSDDLERWTFDGVVARQPAAGWSVYTGAVWECPQLLQIDDDWVMIMSAWDDGVMSNVNYAIGHYDGAAFTARRYGCLTHGAELYATTTFRDREGRTCAMSWLRERGNRAPEGSPWCSAMSLAHVLSVENGVLAVAQHPALESFLAKTAVYGDAPSGGHIEIPVPGYAWRLRFSVEGYLSGGFAVSLAGSAGSFEVKAAGEALVVTDDRGDTLLAMPVSGGDTADVDMVVDADILEITVSGTEGIASTRIPAVSGGDVHIQGLGGTAITGARLSTQP